MSRHILTVVTLGSVVLLLAPMGVARGGETYISDDGDPIDRSPVVRPPGTLATAGAKILVDDFDHRDPTLPGWTLADLSAGQLWGPGHYDPSSGALRIYHSGEKLIPPGTPFQQTAMFALWNESTDPLYSNGFLRAKIRTDEMQNSTGVFMRGDLATATGYDLFGFTKPPASMPKLRGTFFLSKFVNGIETHLWESHIEYLPGEDWNVELGAVGARITGKVWRVGDAEPQVPQFDWIDPDPLPAGQILISSDKSLGNTIPACGDSTFDDIVFRAVPEPAAVALLALCFVGLIVFRIRHH